MGPIGQIRRFDLNDEAGDIVERKTVGAHALSLGSIDRFRNHTLFSNTFSTLTRAINLSPN